MLRRCCGVAKLCLYTDGVKCTILQYDKGTSDLICFISMYKLCPYFDYNTFSVQFKYGFIIIFAALEKLREEFKADSESLAQSEAISILSLCDE